MGACFIVGANEAVQSGRTAPSCCSHGPIREETLIHRRHLGEMIPPSRRSLFLIPLSSVHPHRNTQTHTHVTMEMDGEGGAA